MLLDQTDAVGNKFTQTRLIECENKILLRLLASGYIYPDNLSLPCLVVLDKSSGMTLFKLD